MSEHAFIERRFDAGDGEVLCRFFQPTINPTGEFRCDWQIDWGDRVRKSYSCGIDAIQSLLLAMRIAHTELVVSKRYKNGQLTFLGERDLGLPPHYADDDA